MNRLTDMSTAYYKPNYTGLINTLAYKNEYFESNSTIPVFARCAHTGNIIYYASLKLSSNAIFASQLRFDAKNRAI